MSGTGFISRTSKPLGFRRAPVDSLTWELTARVSLADYWGVRGHIVWRGWASVVHRATGLVGLGELLRCSSGYAWCFRIGLTTCEIRTTSKRILLRRISRSTLWMRLQRWSGAGGKSEQRTKFWWSQRAAAPQSSGVSKLAPCPPYVIAQFSDSLKQFLRNPHLDTNQSSKLV